jgi:excisionase family DNA binding protein
MTGKGDIQTTPSARKSVRAEDKLLLSRQDAAALLSISERSLDYLIANKNLTVRRIGSRVLIPMRDLQRFARANHPQRLVGQVQEELWQPSLRKRTL